MSAGSQGADGGPWLLVIDPQRIFADQASEWGSPMFADAIPEITRLAEAFAGRTIVTRWVPGDEHPGSWGPYFERWTFADRPDDDPLFHLVPEAVGLTDRPTLDVTTFGKYGPELTAITGEHPQLVLTGVATDCCVIATALAATDAGATVTVVKDACAGSTAENHAAALTVMGLYEPQMTVRTTDEVLGDL
ncbi:cysteine hydrolase family protein [Janibacter sp. G56]|uniref:cysteine hydrolase family protein n=1 Tax=Janibacter sp. G56 TaxID=3418717 RepID=UPI003D03DB77